MSSISALQHCFQGAVLAENLDPGLFVPQPGKVGFAIYANAYRARLAEALRDNYPVLFLALGDELFEHIARAYIDSQLSRFRSIRWFGDGLAEFMMQRDDLVPHPALADLAKMDWALRGAFDAANDDALQVSDLAALAPEAWPEQCFQLRASISLVALSWSVEPIWQALSEDENAETAPPESKEHTLLVWRRELECQWRSLSAEETVGLRALAANAPFASICEKVISIDNAASATDVALMLRRWVEGGLLAR